MRGLALALCCGILATVAIGLATAAIVRPAMARETKGKDCRMEQQCHWKDFKKICVWVKVCR